MKENYPVVLNKFILYLGAGMTIRGAFQKIAQDHCGGEKEEYQPLYQEMLFACNRLQAGISESRAYEMWAARTGLQDCARLSALLIQFLQFLAICAYCIFPMESMYNIVAPERGRRRKAGAVNVSRKRMCHIISIVQNSEMPGP